MEPLSFVYFAWTLTISLSAKKKKVHPAEPKARMPRFEVHPAELIGSAVTTLFFKSE